MWSGFGDVVIRVLAMVVAHREESLLLSLAQVCGLSFVWGSQISFPVLPGDPHLLLPSRTFYPNSPLVSVCFP